MVQLASEAWRFELVEHEGRTILITTVGTVALDDLAIELTADERRVFDERGVEGLIELVRAVESAPSRFAQRRVPVPR